MKQRSTPGWPEPKTVWVRVEQSSAQRVHLETCSARTCKFWRRSSMVISVVASLAMDGSARRGEETMASGAVAAGSFAPASADFELLGDLAASEGEFFQTSSG